MKSAWNEVQPNHIYQVFKSLPLTEEGNDGLLHLYQPIIGSHAMALYYALLGDEEDQHENEFAHIDVLNALNLGLPDFLTARKHLEGVGLLSVFMKEDPEFGKIFLYQLEEPLHPQAFLKDEVYSYLLWNVVGERKFNQIVERFKPKKVDTSAYREITSSFSDVYGALNEESFVRKSSKLEQISKDYEVHGKTLQLEDQLDWKFLIDVAKKKFIAESNFTPEFRKQLLLYHNLYGLDELTLVNMMAEVVSLSDGQVDSKALAKYMNQQNKTRPQKQTVAQLSPDDQTRRFNTLKQTGFSEMDLELVQMSEETAPVDFLQAIKREKHSFVTDSESWLLKSLVEKSPLPNSVINVLMHYVLVIQKNSTLQANFVNKIATDWSEIGIKSPEAAIQHVRQLVKESKEKVKRPRTPYKQQPVRKETLPDWVDNPTEEVEDPAQQAAINQRLQEYLKRKEGEK
ncbi:DnaD domain protein [Enterococcus saccharolyticus]|uniref:replication initiation and membrane attachment family protein n=1 Tax=Enterococcus TaxID=1350 RepID=UPI001E484022|nr:DnaD domain protein [Enterococcus saccharolyticus]MCD5003478.1 DnaD domain protein [Enterococcus saccharolyticus]